MRIEPFLLERFFAPYEFEAKHVLCASDCESIRVRTLLQLEPSIAETMADLHLGYSPVDGMPGLVNELVALHPGSTPAGVTIVPGGGSAIELVLRSVLDSGDPVVVLTPTYQSHVTLPRALGCPVNEVALKDDTGGWTLDPQALADAVRPATKAIVVNLPNSPTGFHANRESFEAVLDVARQAGAYLISDEIFRLLEHDPATRLPSAIERYDRAIVLGALSKAFGLPGLRIGWVVSGDPEVVKAVSELKDYSAKDASAPSQLLAIAALRHREHLLSRNRRLALDNLKLLDGFFERNGDLVRWHRPTAGVVGFPHLVRGDGKDLFRSLYDATGVLIAPGSLFDMPDTYFRIGFGYADFPEALALFEDHLVNTHGTSRC